jgi:nonsense-mediated mRNA decay protein 3
VHLNKEERIDDTGKNIDYYLTNQSYAKVLAEKLRSNFGGIIKKNAQLFSVSWETSKNLYRLNILVELPIYSKGDVIKKDGQLYRIISMDTKIHAINLKTNSKTSLPHKNSYDILKPVEVMLIKRYPESEILDPNTYYQARLMNPSEKLEINQKLHVVIDGGEAWMVKE